MNGIDLKILRIRRWITTIQLAGAMKITQGRISQIENLETVSKNLVTKYVSALCKLDMQNLEKKAREYR